MTKCVVQSSMVNLKASTAHGRYLISAVELSSDSYNQVDLVVVGSVAVCSTGARIGKGEGFAELEYGILKWMGAIDDSTIVATTVHDEQVAAIICF